MIQNKKEKDFQFSKDNIQKILSFICIFLSFWLLNSYLMKIAGISFSKNSSLWISNSFFSLSWIFLLIGIIYMFQGLSRRIVSTVFFLIFSIITCLESVSFTVNGKYVSLDHFEFSISKLIESMSEEFILYFFFSFLLLLVSWSLLKKVNVKKRNFYQLSFSLLTIIFLFGLCRSVAYYSMGPQIVYTSGKESNDLKTVYLEHKKEHFNFKISGLYDFTLKECYYGVIKQIQKTDQYLRN